MKFNTKFIKKYKYPTLLSITTLVLLFIFQNGSCGTSSTTSQTGGSTISQPTSLDTSTPAPTVAPTSTPDEDNPSATPTPTPVVGNIYNLPAAQSFTATVNGVGGPSPTWVSPTTGWYMGNVYKVKVSPLAAPPIAVPGYADWTFPYGCVTLQVTVNGVTATSEILRVPGISQPAGSVCANSPTEQVFDFSNTLNSNPLPAEPQPEYRISGPISPVQPILPIAPIGPIHGGPIQGPIGGNNYGSNVVISNANYDNCQFSNPLIYGCAMSAEFQNHVVAATVTIQSQFTWMDP